MICLRCGYCCENLAVIIVDDPNKGICEDKSMMNRGMKKPLVFLIHKSKEVMRSVEWDDI